MFVGAILLSVCFEKDIRSILSFFVGPVLLVSGSYFACAFVRDWYGSNMSVSNFCVLTFVYIVVLALLYTVFMKGRPA